LENFATTLGSREQLAIAEFAEALLVIPKTLAVNAAQDSTELVAKLRAHHNIAQTDPTKKELTMYYYFISSYLQIGLDWILSLERLEIIWNMECLSPVLARLRVSNLL
jgi:hypothetical protein